MMAITLTTKNKDMVFSHGQMAEGMKDNGTMESNMAKVSILRVKVILKQENGKMAKESKVSTVILLNDFND